MNRALLESTAVSTAKRKFHPYPTYCRSEVWGVPAIPEHWQEKPLKCLVAINTDKLPETTDPDYEIEYVDIGNVNLEAGITSTEQYRFENAPSRARRKVRHGDTIVSTVRTYLKAVAQIVNPPNNLIVSTGFAVLRAKPPLDPGFLYRLAQSEPLIERIMAHSVGVSYPAINASDIGKFTIPLPPADEQWAIAAFLDRETARIDELIAKKQRLIEFLKEKRQAVISRAVTKGLDSNTPMKPSGIDWLGDVPAHWAILRVKHIARVGNGSTPSRENAEYWYEGHYPWLNSSVVNSEVVTEAEQFVTDIALRECHLPRVLPPAVLVGITGEGKTRGMATTLLMEATVNQHLAFLKPKSERCDVFFLRRVLDIAYQFLRDDSDGGGSTKGAITCEQLGNLSIPLPPLPEQKQISSLLDDQSKRIAVLVDESETAIGKLREYRSSLITAAVTGQIDVRNYHAEAIS